MTWQTRTLSFLFEFLACFVLPVPRPFPLLRIAALLPLCQFDHRPIRVMYFSEGKDVIPFFQASEDMKITEM